MTRIIQHGGGETVNSQFVFAVVNGISAFPDFREIAEQSGSGKERGVGVACPFDFFELFMKRFFIQKRQNCLSDSGAVKRRAASDQGSHAHRTHAFNLVDVKQLTVLQFRQMHGLHRPRGKFGEYRTRDFQQGILSGGNVAEPRNAESERIG